MNKLQFDKPRVAKALVAGVLVIGGQFVFNHAQTHGKELSDAASVVGMGAFALGWVVMGVVLYMSRTGTGKFKQIASIIGPLLIVGGTGVIAGITGERTNKELNFAKAAFVIGWVTVAMAAAYRTPFVKEFGLAGLAIAGVVSAIMVAPEAMDAAKAKAQNEPAQYYGAMGVLTGAMGGLAFLNGATKTSGYASLY